MLPLKNYFNLQEIQSSSNKIMKTADSGPKLNEFDQSAKVKWLNPPKRMPPPSKQELQVNLILKK